MHFLSCKYLHLHYWKAIKTCIVALSSMTALQMLTEIQQHVAHFQVGTIILEHITARVVLMVLVSSFANLGVDFDFILTIFSSATCQNGDDNSKEYVSCMANTVAKILGLKLAEFMFLWAIAFQFDNLGSVVLFLLFLLLLSHVQVMILSILLIIYEKLE